MIYLDQQRLDTLDGPAFRERRPYPWVNPAGLLNDAAYEVLCQNLPPVELFTPSFGIARKHGQQAHDRYVLEYEPRLTLPAPWKEFIHELGQRSYRKTLSRLFGTDNFRLRYHWHYTPTGCSVSPHCDNKAKLGSHIFYFNHPDEWEPDWGGETVILDDGGRFGRESAPSFADFDRCDVADAQGNRSLLFLRNGNSWHGVRPLRCPENYMRRVFIVVIDQAAKPRWWPLYRGAAR